MMRCIEPENIRFMRVKISNINYKKISEKIRDNLARKAYICLTDVGNVIRASKDKEFLEAIDNSLISIADGMPLVWYGKLIGCRTIERLAGMELMARLLEEQSEFKHFLLGDTEDTIKRILEKARNIRKEVIIDGYSPPFRSKFDEVDNKVIFRKIEEKNPDIIWVSLGGGKQDKWMYQNVNRLRRGVMIGVGAAFRFYIGSIKTPPAIFQKMGLQWLFRTLENPKTIGRRLRTIPKFIIHFPLEVAKARSESNHRTRRLLSNG